MNSDFQDNQPRETNAPFEVELGNTHITVNPKAADDQKPKNWKEARKMINLAAMDTAVSAVRLSADALNAVRSLVRGIGDLPSALGDRLRKPIEIRRRARAKIFVVSQEQLNPNKDPQQIENPKPKGEIGNSSVG